MSAPEVAIDCDLKATGNQKTPAFGSTNFESAQSVFVTAGEGFDGSGMATIVLRTSGGNDDGIVDHSPSFGGGSNAGDGRVSTVFALRGIP